MPREFSGDRRGSRTDDAESREAPPKPRERDSSSRVTRPPTQRGEADLSICDKTWVSVTDSVT